MKYLRQSVFDEDGHCVTQVVAETSLKADIHVCANAMREHGYPDMVDIEIFEHGGTLMEASVEGKNRAQKRIPEKRRHQDTLHDWAISMLHMVTKDGVIGTRHPAPLSAKAILPVMEKVVANPNYKRQQIIVTAKDGNSFVKVDNGKILKLEKI